MTSQEAKRRLGSWNHNGVTDMEMLAIKTRVKFAGNLLFGEVTGTVVEQYYGGERCFDEEAREYYISPHSVAVKVDHIPDGWPYPDTDIFAPDVDKLEVID